MGVKEVAEKAGENPWLFFVIPLLCLAIAATWALLEREQNRVKHAQAKYCLLLDDEIEWFKYHYAVTQQDRFGNQLSRLEVTKQIERCPETYPL